MICSDTEHFENEKSFIKNVLSKNNYPENFIENTFQKIENINNNQVDRENNYTNNLIIPYIPGFSEKIKRVAKHFNIRTIFKTENSLRSLLTRTKPENEIQKTKNCVQKIPCECGKFYIGETGRPLGIRVQEHIKYVKNCENSKSKISEHAWTNHHKIIWENAKIILKEERARKRKIKETAVILLNKENCMSEFSVDISKIWLSVLKQKNLNLKLQ